MPLQGSVRVSVGVGVRVDVDVRVDGGVPVEEGEPVHVPVELQVVVWDEDGEAVGLPVQDGGADADAVGVAGSVKVAVGVQVGTEVRDGVGERV